MSRILIIILVGVLISFWACTPNNKDDTETGQSAEEGKNPSINEAAGPNAPAAAVSDTTAETQVNPTPESSSSKIEYGLIALGLISLLSLVLNLMINSKLRHRSQLQDDFGEEDKNGYSDLLGKVESIKNLLDSNLSELKGEGLRDLIQSSLQQSGSSFPEGLESILSKLTESQIRIETELKEIRRVLPRSDPGSGRMPATDTREPRVSFDPGTLINEYNTAVNPNSPNGWLVFTDKHRLRALSYEPENKVFVPNEAGLVAGVNSNNEYYILPSNRYKTIDQNTIDKYKLVFDIEGEVYQETKLHEYRLVDAAFAKTNNEGQIVMIRRGKLRRIS